MKKKKINLLVFPCGSEIGLEIHRSLKYSTHINLIGANSVDDHGKFVYEHYVGGLPFANDGDFISSMQKVIQDNEVDAIYPAMDSVLTILKENEALLNCKVIGSPLKTTQICLSKTKTYQELAGVVPTARSYNRIEDVSKYPVFIKPDIGYGSRGAKLIANKEEGRIHLQQYPNSVILEYLPGTEYTVDCFSDRRGKLLFYGPRIRNRIMNGISVNTRPYKERQEEFSRLANAINKNLTLRGAWFFQVKESENGEMVLLEVASRLGGSSSLYRNLGVNFAMLSTFDTFGYDVTVFTNDYNIELDRALDNKYKVTVNFDKAYVDFDDCVLLGQSVNLDMIKLMFQFRNNKKRLILITKHERDIHETLAHFRLSSIFDEVIHLKSEDEKYRYMDSTNAIFIDDSHAERMAVYENLGIPVFAPDAIECLLD